MSTITATAQSASDFWGDPIHVYTRADALNDGVLVDLTPLAVEYGFKWPVALTAAAHADTVAWSEADEARKGGTGQDETGRAWDVLTMVRHALPTACREAQQRGTATVPFSVYRVPAEGRGVMARRAHLVLHLGPDDNGQPCITVTLPNED